MLDGVAIIGVVCGLFSLGYLPTELRITTSSKSYANLTACHKCDSAQCLRLHNEERR